MYSFLQRVLYASAELASGHPIKGQERYLVTFDGKSLTQTDSISKQLGRAPCKCVDTSHEYKSQEVATTLSFVKLATD